MKACQAAWLLNHTDISVPKAVDLQLGQYAHHCSHQMPAEDGESLFRRIWEHEQR
jgi:hypothetical protein